MDFGGRSTSAAFFALPLTERGHEPSARWDTSEAIWAVFGRLRAPTLSCCTFYTDPLRICGLSGSSGGWGGGLAGAPPAPGRPGDPRGAPGPRGAWVLSPLWGPR